MTTKVFEVDFEAQKGLQKCLRSIMRLKKGLQKHLRSILRLKKDYKGV